MNASIEKVLLDPANPHDFSLDELNELAERLRHATGDVDAAPALRDEEGYGGPLSEVIYIWLTWSSVVGQVETARKTAEIATAAVSWLRKRWRADHSVNGERARKRVLVLCDRHGRIFEEIEIDLPDGQPVRREIVEVTEVPHGKPTPSV